jgi:hypothetical protein
MTPAKIEFRAGGIGRRHQIGAERWRPQAATSAGGLNGAVGLSATNSAGTTAGMPEVFYPYADLAAAHAFAGHDKEAKEAAAQLQKLYPGFTVQTLLGLHWTDDPTFNAQYQRLAEGLRKAGVPEGEKKAD